MIETVKVVDGDGKALGTLQIDVDAYPEGVPDEIKLRFDNGATGLYTLEEVQD